MFTSDAAAVMLDRRNGVAKLLQNSVLHFVEQHCVAHRGYLEIEDAWSKFLLMQDIETLVTTFYTSLSRPSIEMQGLQVIAEASGHDLITFKAGMRKHSFFCGSGSAKILPLPLPHRRLFDWKKSNLAKKFCPFPNVD